MGGKSLNRILLDQNISDDSIALTFDNSISYEKLRETVMHTKEKLEFRGITETSIVALKLPNSYTFVYVLLALWEIGAVVELLDFNLNKYDLEKRMGILPPEFLIFSPEKPVSIVTENVNFTVQTLKSNTDKDKIENSSIIFFTSGSTGTPKTIIRSINSIYSEILRTSIVEGVVEKKDKVLCLVPFSHTYGLVTVLLHSLYKGATLTFSRKNIANDILDSIKEKEVTVIYGVPFHYELLIHTKCNRSLGKVRAVVSAGETLSSDVNNKFHEKYGSSIGQQYGMSEVGIVSVDMLAKYIGTVGKPLLKVLFNENNNEISIYTKTNPYLSDPLNNYNNSFLRTGDSGLVDERGLLCIEGRTDSMVTLGGENVYLTEIEEVLKLMPDIDDCLVLYNGTITCYFTSSKELKKKKLLEWCQENLSHYKIPKKFYKIKEFPKTNTGKKIRKFTPYLEGGELLNG